MKPHLASRPSPTPTSSQKTPDTKGRRCALGMILRLLDALGTVRLASEWWQPDHPLNHVLHVSVPPNISEAAAWHGTGVGESLPAEYAQRCNTWVQTLPQQKSRPSLGLVLNSEQTFASCDGHWAILVHSPQKDARVGTLRHLSPTRKSATHLALSPTHTAQK